MFFFSSRRRHTRCGRDWSSDVCSSDLVILRDKKAGCICQMQSSGTRGQLQRLLEAFAGGGPLRSEERRVGKECRTRWWRASGKKKKKKRHSAVVERQPREQGIRT